jgi:hypothetical protein
MVGEHASRRYGRPGNAKYLRTASPVRSSTIAFARRVFRTMESLGAPTWDADKLKSRSVVLGLTA